MVKFTLSLMVALSVTMNTTVAQTWQSLDGPWCAKNVRQIAVSSDANNLIMYAADSGSTLMRWNDNAERWEPTPDVINHPRIVSCSNENANLVVAGYIEGNYGVIKASTDAGDNWDYTPINEQNLIPLSLAYAPANAMPGRVRMGTNPIEIDGYKRPLWKSSNNGATIIFDDNFKQDTYITALLFHPTNPDTIYV